MERNVELQQWAEARANVYHFLSGLYNTPPTPEVVNQMAGGGFADYLEQVFAQSAERMGHFLQDFTDDEAGYRALKLEYDALFRVPGDRYTRPYEAVHRHKRTGGKRTTGGLVWGPATVAVQKVYSQAGAAISEKFKELPDFIGLELEFMRFLCAQEAEAWERDDADTASRYRGWQQKFLSEHLAQWVGAFCQEMAARAESDFYRGLAEMTQEYVVQDCEEVKGLIEEIKVGE
jgi:TorA maturation chaperone TorD